MDDVFETTGAIDKPALKALSARNDLRGLAQLAGHGVALLGSGVLVTGVLGSPWLLPALVLHGVVLVFLFAPLHETIHATAFRNRALNRAVAFLCGLVLFLPSGYFRAFHFAHHRYTQDEGRDPELARPKPARLGDYLLTLSGVLYWRDQAEVLARLALGRVEHPFIPQRQHKAVIREVRALIAIYAAIALASFALGSTAALTYWLIPLVLGQPALRAFLLAEHTGCPLVPDMLKNSRTTTSNPLIRRLVWNMNYHAEHHAYPALPFHALPKAHGLMKDKIAVRATGYLAVHRQLTRQLGE